MVVHLEILDSKPKTFWHQVSGLSFLSNMTVKMYCGAGAHYFPRERSSDEWQPYSNRLCVKSLNDVSTEGISLWMI